MKQYLLGIDVGTTGTKTLLFSDSGEVLGHAYRSYPLHTPQPRFVEQEAEDWWRTVVETVREVCEGAGVTRVAAISLSTQGGTVVPTDAAGNPLRRAIVWSDLRGIEQSRAFRARYGDRLLYELTGWNCSDGLPLMYIRWLQDHEPEIMARAERILTVPDYVSLRMTGKSVVDISNAGINQFCDIRTGRYDSRLLEFAGIREEMLPKIVPSGTVIGELTAEASRELGLEEGTVLVAGAHDQYAAALGGGVVHSGEVLIGSGTCWVVTGIHDAPRFESGLAQSVSAVPGKWGSIYSLESGGVCLEWLRKMFAAGGELLPYEKLNELSAAGRGAEDGMFFFPASGKLDAEHVFERSNFVGMSLSHGCGDVVRAVMEGVVFQTRWMMESFGTQEKDAAIVLSGGAGKSPIWSQLTAEITGRPVRIPAVADLPCVGAAILAGAGCGIFADVQSGHAALGVGERLLTPSEEKTALYETLYETYKQTAAALGTVGARREE